MSRNSPETGLRILNNIREYEIPITRNPFTGGLARLSRSVGPVSIGNGRAGDSSDCTLVAPNIDYAKFGSGGRVCRSMRLIFK
jgi:hypothetical protein